MAAEVGFVTIWTKPYGEHEESNPMSKPAQPQTGRRSRRYLVGSGVAVAALVAGAAPAFANTSTPAGSASATVSPDGKTVTLTGNWNWPGQVCSGRYGTSWAVDWWGVSTSPSPANNFTVQATEITDATQPATTGPVSATGSLKIPHTAPQQYFHVGTHMAGQQVFTSAFCSTVGDPKNPSGSWTATATYADPSDIPAELCVVTYDLHFGSGTSVKASDEGPTTNGDNSLKVLSQTPGSSTCAAVNNNQVPVGALGTAGFAGAAGLGLFIVQRRRRRN